MDLMSLATDVIGKISPDFTLDDVNLFRDNPGFQQFHKYYKGLIEEIVNFLQQSAQSFGARLPITSRIELATTLDFWRNMVLGRSGDAHSHLMEYFYIRLTKRKSYGIQAFTLKGYTKPGKYLVPAEENIIRTCAILETILRTESNLDEQLHAGSYFYFPTSSRTFQSSNVYLYPIGLCLAGFVIPRVINYYKRSQYSPLFYETTIFLAMSHIVGIVHLLTPTWIEKAYSFITGHDAKFREELPAQEAYINDTKYVFLTMYQIWKDDNNMVCKFNSNISVDNGICVSVCIDICKICIQSNI